MSSSELRAAKAVKVAERDRYVRRKQQVDTIINNTNAVVGAFPGKINTLVTEVETDFSNAIKGKSSSMTPYFDETVQKSISSDTTMSSVLSNLSSESSHCARKISALNSQIADLDRQIAAAVAAEEAARRAAEEAARCSAARRR